WVAETPSAGSLQAIAGPHLPWVVRVPPDCMCSPGAEPARPVLRHPRVFGLPPLPTQSFFSLLHRFPCLPHSYDDLLIEMTHFRRSVRGLRARMSLQAC